ncbi:acyl transferase domain-containing protein [Aspergillus egyptiacus]|nr:acyl transferase domain-containing protein [Aspergillus egyptiacus]
MALDENLSGPRDSVPSTPSPNGLSPSSSSDSLYSTTCLFLQHNGISLRLRVPDAHFPFIESQLNAFLGSYSCPSNASTQLELALSFIDYLLAQQTIPPVILSTVLKSFESEFLHDEIEIHALIADLIRESDKRQQWLGIYYRLIEASDGIGTERTSSALLQHGKTNEFQLLAVFGGQGESSRTCVQELGELYAAYKPMLRRLLRVIGPRLCELSMQDECNSYYKGQRLDLEAWVNEPSTAPDLGFIASGPVSVPIIGILSLARYCVICHIAGVDPGEMRSAFRATTGHSQGILISIVIAMSGSWDSFYHHAQQIVEVLFYLGLECHNSAPCSIVPAENYSDGTDASAPSYMLSVRGLSIGQLETILEKVNTGLPADKRLYLSLVNSHEQFVIAGPVASLLRLDNYITSISSQGEDQSRVPFSNRKICVQHHFLPVSTPFHTNYLALAAQRVKERFADHLIQSQHLKIPVYHTGSGKDLRQHNGCILSSAIDAIACEKCDWPSALAGCTVSHVIAFDRGGLAQLTKKVTDGQGVRVIQATDLDSKDSEIGTIRDLLCPSLLDTSTRVQSWAQQFHPSLVVGPTVHLETRLNRIIGAPPVIVAGMTPTTKNPDFVAAVMNAGYHAELAGGGYHTVSAMEGAIRELAGSISQGRGITCNLIYANPRSMAWQIKLLRRLSRAGVPIDGLTIGAGVPSPEVASQYIETLGLRHISFKPGSALAIRQVVEIAKKHPGFPVILQWTGGRGGGHHSFEDFHAPILATYGAIRKQPNIYLLAGSGFGDSNSIYPYLTGSWSVTRGHPLMPFDGVLLGSRMMVAEEAHTSTAVRKVIVNTPGLPDQEWERTYTGVSGGLITVKSEMGEPIHKIATRGVRLWAELDNTVFHLPGAERVAYLARHRQSIIRRLNQDYARPWFGCNIHGEVVDLEEMTYLDVLSRLIELMYISHQNRWVDISYVEFTMTIANRWLERHPPMSKNGGCLNLGLLINSPTEFLLAFSGVCPTAGEDLLTPEDVSFFLMQCKQPCRKPVNFIPALNEDFEFYFKKDSLWQAEDVDAVVGRDAERVCILHGPVAARYSRYECEPVAGILGDIESGLVSRLEKDHQGEDLVSSLGSGFDTPASWSTISSDGRATSEETSSTSITSLLVSTNDKRVAVTQIITAPLRGPLTWMRAMLENSHIMQGNVRQKNPFRHFMQIYPKTSVDWDSDKSKLVICEGEKHESSISVMMTCHNSSDILVEVYPSKESDPLRLFYRFIQSDASYTLSEILERRNERIKAFYCSLWLERDFGLGQSMEDTFYGPQMTITHELLYKMNSTVGSAFPDHRHITPSSDLLPIHSAIVIAWEAISRPLTLQQINVDLLRLVHQSNTFYYSEGASPLRVGDKVSSKSRVQAVYEQDSGLVVVVEGQIIRADQTILTVTSTFLFRGSSTERRPIPTFRRETFTDLSYLVASELEESILLSREWFVLHNPSVSLLGKTVRFEIESLVKQPVGQRRSLRVTGRAFCQSLGSDREELATICLKGEACAGNPVIDFLQRRGMRVVPRTDFQTPGWQGRSTVEVQMPPSNAPYAQLSHDFNPIHTSQLFACLAMLPGPLCHGMYTSAIAERVLEYLVLEGDRKRLRRFNTTFTDMVMPQEKLIVQIKHAGMIDGRMRLNVIVRRKTTTERVLEAEAEVEQPKTVYLFTGQGSQSRGMGMDLYSTSSVAKAVWDKVDQHMFNTYGWSILDIVRDNPKTLTVHFGGRNGRKIRQKYLGITTDVVLPDGSRVQKPVLAGLTATSSSYTFEHPKGLLYLTQFAQPAILLFEAAAFADLRCKGYVSRGALYAGHSLGEYGALAALSNSIPTSALVELAFYRGSVMQASVARDDLATTAYGMIAMNPKRVGRDFIVRQIAVQSGELLEIVNYNIEGEQYVCSGTTANLYVLGRLVDYIADAPDGPRLVDLASPELYGVIDTFIADAEALPRPIQLERGKATIPLEGIDVPFHSRHLRNTVDRFRKCLLQPGFLVDTVDVEQLIGNYIPNLMAKPFSLDKEYIQEALELTGSPILAEILSGM